MSREGCCFTGSQRTACQKEVLLRNWVSNSPKVLELISEEQARVGESNSESKMVVEDTKSYAKTTTGNLERLEMTNQHKVLGLNWNCVSDKFTFKFEALSRLAEGVEPTRRNLLKVTSSLFDPLGILSPVLVHMKVLFQTLCEENVDWDVLLLEEARKQWNKWLSICKRCRKS